MAKNKNMKSMRCMICPNYVEVDNASGAVVCADCISKIMPAPAHKPIAKVTKVVNLKVKKGEKAKTVTVKTKGFGRGWHLKKEFIAPDGAVYRKGVLVKEAPAKK